jgi:hypothetical protein
MRSESQLANFDVFGTSALEQRDLSSFTLKSPAVTGSGRELEKPIGSGRMEEVVEGLGPEVAEAVGVATKLHELMKERDEATPEVQANWNLAFQIEPDEVSREEARRAHDSIRSRIEGAFGINPHELPDGSVPPTLSARDTAVSATEALFHGRGILFQHVSPLPDGGIELEFESARCYIGLWVHDRNHIDVLIRRGSIEHSQLVRLDQILDVIWERLV